MSETTNDVTTSEAAESTAESTAVTEPAQDVSAAELVELQEIKAILEDYVSYLKDRNSQQDLAAQELAKSNAEASELSAVEAEEQAALLEQQRNDYLTAESEFREQLLTAVSGAGTDAATAEVLAENNQLLESLVSLESEAAIVQPSEEELMYQQMENLANTGIVAFVMVLIPVFFLIRFFKTLLSPLY